MLGDLQKIVEKVQIETHHAHVLGNNGAITVYATSEEDVVNVVKYANKNEQKLTVISGGTKRGFGGNKEIYDIELSLKRFKGIVAHSQGDLTMTVKPGTTLKEIMDYLAPFQQMLPIDPYWPAYTTIGGLIAANESGPKRLKYGSARDFVIGLRVVYPNGQVIRTGGKVVKNVAGYDMNKLFIGSMGTLGIVTEVTVKLRPLPKFESLLLLSFPNKNVETIHSFVKKVIDSYLEPVSLELLNPMLSNQLCRQRQFTLAIALEDVEKSVHYQEQIIKTIKTEEVEMKVLQQETAIHWWNKFSEIFTHPADYENEERQKVEVILKINSKSMDVPAIIQYCDELGDKLQIDALAHGGVGHGVSRAYLKGEIDFILSFIRELRFFMTEIKGSVIVQHAPFDFRKNCDVWEKRPAYFPLMERIKWTVDPKKTLNEQRFIGGI